MTLVALEYYSAAFTFCSSQAVPQDNEAISRDTRLSSDIKIVEKSLNSAVVGDNLVVSDSPVPVCAVAVDVVLTGFSC